MTGDDIIVVFMTVLYVITMIVGLAGITLLIYIVWRKPGARNVTKILFVNMAVAVLLIVVFQMPFSLAHFYIFGGFLDDFTCWFLYYVICVSFLASILSLTVMACYGYFAVTLLFCFGCYSAPFPAEHLVQEAQDHHADYF